MAKKPLFGTNERIIYTNLSKIQQKKKTFFVVANTVVVFSGKVIKSFGITSKKFNMLIIRRGKKPINDRAPDTRPENLKQWEQFNDDRKDNC